MSKKLYVGNLSFKATDEDVKTLFAAYGEVQNVSIVTDRYSGRSRGFAFVEMTSDDSATKAREALNGKPYQERNLTVDWARPEGERREGGSSGGGSRGRDFSQRKPFRSR